MLISGMANNSYRCVPLRFFRCKQISINLILHNFGFIVDSMSDLMMVLSFEILHVLGIINLTMTDTSNFSSSFCVVLWEFLCITDTYWSTN